MPAIGTIAINDGKATPVSHSFAPVTTDGSTAKWANRAASIPQGYEQMSIEIRAPSSSTAAYRIVGSLILPTVATVNGQDVVVRSNKLDFTINLGQLSTTQDRKDAVVLLSNLLANASVQTAVQNLEPFY